jgi:hypothetical protein
MPLRLGGTCLQGAHHLKYENACDRMRFCSRGGAYLKNERADVGQRGQVDKLDQGVRHVAVQDGRGQKSLQEGEIDICIFWEKISCLCLEHLFVFIKWKDTIKLGIDLICPDHALSKEVLERGRKRKETQAPIDNLVHLKKHIETKFQYPWAKCTAFKDLNTQLRTEPEMKARQIISHPYLKHRDRQPEDRADEEAEKAAGLKVVLDTAYRETVLHKM